ncbi:hypothetical protein F5141DRAFT_1067136 [Pisolithus sp. B1]|nr:hypothetical protein F5141DRAFT_1067136 [Pisolithus sp. B1]
MTHADYGFVVEDEGNGVQKVTAEEIALEEEKLKRDSAEDVRRQLEQQHVAELEEKAVQVGRGLNIWSVWLTPAALQRFERVADNALGEAEHTTESVISDGAVGVEDLQEDYAALSWRYILWPVHGYVALTSDIRERILPLSICISIIRLKDDPREFYQREEPTSFDFITAHPPHGNGTSFGPSPLRGSVQCANDTVASRIASGTIITRSSSENLRPVKYRIRRITPSSCR